jgi:hypothetical protein
MSTINWSELAWNLDEASVENPRVPLHVLTGEAVDVARFCQRRWAAQRDASGAVVMPGLELVENQDDITPTLGEEILELSRAVQDAQSEYLLTIPARPEPAPLERAEFILSEISAVLEWLLDDGTDDEKDAQLERLETTYRESRSQDALAAALDDYVALASRHRDELDGLGNFDVALLDEGKQVATQLRERSAARIGVQNPSAERRAQEHRNRLAALLGQRINRVRAAARFVFRSHPEVIREVTSTYERRRRAARRRNAVEAEENQAAEGAAQEV